MSMRFAAVLAVTACSLCVSGCATLQQKTPDQEKQELKARVTYLENELNKQKDSNAQLRLKLDELNKKEVRMPSATEIQTALKKSGYYKGEVDGHIGSKTRDAIKRFQEANKLTADGVVGSRTWELLSKYLQQ